MKMKNHFLILFDSEEQKPFEKYKGELFVEDDRYPEDIVKIYKLKGDYKGQFCPRCGSVSNYYHLEYNDNNGVIGRKIVCPYCYNIKDSHFDTDEKILKHFDYIKELILKNRK